MEYVLFPPLFGILSLTAYNEARNGLGWACGWFGNRLVCPRLFPHLSITRLCRQARLAMGVLDSNPFIRGIDQSDDLQLAIHYAGEHTPSRVKNPIYSR